MSSASSSWSTFFVSLSFRGEETRRNFVSHLRCSLNQRGISTLEDENELRGGQAELSVVEGTITQESKVAVVVISEHYVSSPLCLKSLVKILEFHQSGSLAVIPVFYDIEPSDVRKQSGKLYEPFLLHEIENPKKVQTWRQTLSELANIPSCQYSTNWKGDAELIEKVTNIIWGMLIGSKSSDLCGLVGMDRHMKAMYRLLDIGLKDEARRIYIWGREGIGKTTFAKYLYEEIWHHFHSHFWLDLRNIRSQVGFDDIKLRKDLLLKLKGIGGLRERVLLVLDDVDDFDFINGLKKEFDMFGPGSRVIITTTKTDISHLDIGYEVKGLEFSEALQLFCLHAFDLTHPSLGFEELSCRAVKLTGGSPSILHRLGTRLYGRGRNEWEVILSGYERISSSTGIIASNKVNVYYSETDSVFTPSSTMNYSNDLVGMDLRMQELCQLLELGGSEKEVREAGIWGTGGIGKTTLARYVYEDISKQFHTHFFLENVEDYHSSSTLEERFLAKAIQREDFAVRYSEDVVNEMKSWLRHQKVLLIVDGVDDKKTIEDVRKVASWFGPRSRVILTTRDKSLLLDNKVKHVYEVKCLSFVEALQLFYQLALERKPPSHRFKQLSVHAIKLVGFLPLALKVTASMLYGKDETYWETILQSIQAKQYKGKVEVSAK